jgi:putative membrane protein
MTLLKMKMTSLAAAAALCCSVAAVAQNDPMKSMASDKTFVMMADEGNSAEIAASQIALKKSKNPDVKAYAQQMITDHQKLRSDMAPFAQKMSVMTPQPLNQTHKVESQRLAQLHGAKFDAEYIKAMDMDHHKTLGMFNNEIATTSNPDLKSAVQSAQAVIQQHTDMADQLAQKMNITVPPMSGN